MLTEPYPASETANRMEKWPEGECVFRVMVPWQKLGSITDLTEKISQDTKTDILIAKAHRYDTNLVVLICSEEEKGAPLSPAMDALIRVFKHVNGFPEDENDGVASNISSCSIRLVVRSNQVKGLIGKQGSLIKTILESTSCSYRLLWGDELSSTYLCADDRIINLYGEALKVVHALEVVGTYLRTPPKMRLPLKRKRATQIRTPSPSPPVPSSPWSPAIPVPPHPWLQFENPIFQERYSNIHNACWIYQRPLVDSVLQEFGVLESVEKYLTYAPWRRLFHLNDAEYRVLTLEFLSTFELHKIPSTDPGYITFHLGGLPRSFSLVDWAVITDLYTLEESRSPAFQIAISKCPAHWDHYTFWDEHGNGWFIDTSDRKTCQLKDPAFRILQKALSHSLCARRAIHGNIVSSTELFFLTCMSKPRDCNIAAFLARLFSRYSTSQYPRCVIGARFITRIAHMLQIDLSDLEEEPRSETWNKQRLEEVGILVPGDHGGLVLAPPARECIPEAAPARHDPNCIPVAVPAPGSPSKSTSQQLGSASQKPEGVRSEQILKFGGRGGGRETREFGIGGKRVNSGAGAEEAISIPFGPVDIPKHKQTAIWNDQTQMMTTLVGLVDDISEIGRVVGLLAARHQIPTRLRSSEPSPSAHHHP